MPRKPPTLKLIANDSGKQRPDPRPAPSRRGYGRDWQRCRLAKLADDTFCEHCLSRGLYVAATEVDHIRPLASGGEHYERENLQSLCKPCHSRKTAAEDGGFGRAKDADAK